MTKKRKWPKLLSRNDWLALIDIWMKIQGQPTMDWETIMELEGGYGATKIRSVKEALFRPMTHPGRWFRSTQEDYSFYSEHDYVYSLLFGRMISGGTFKIIAQDILEQSDGPFTVVDWGGTIFTAVDLMMLTEDYIKEVFLVNYPGPQLEFAVWAMDQLEYAGRIITIHEYAASEPESPMLPGEIMIMSEVLEHVQSPAYYLNRVMRIHKPLITYVANSFCTPAYGHHIPIKMGSNKYYTTRTANKAWKMKMEKLRYALEKLPGWNSRVWKVTK